MSALVAVVAGFAGGVFVRSLFFTSWWPILFVILLATLFATVAFLKPRRAYALGAIFCLCVALGMGRATLADTPLPSAFANHVKERVQYEGIVSADPDVRDANQRVEIRVESGGDSTTVLAVAPRYPAVAVGDRVWVSGTLAIPEAFADDSGRIFRYDKYLERNDVRFLLNYAYIRVESSAPWYSVPALLARIKHAFLDGLVATLPEPYASLAGGIVIGGKSGLGGELKNVFVRSGLIQIIVLSGYNVMVVAEWIMAGLAFARAPRRWSAAGGALAILVFVGVAGFSATALRALVMALIALYARATGRTYAAGRALLFVILLMLALNPLYLAFDPGFGLSVAATAGLIWLAPIIEMYVSFIKNAFWKNALATTLAAQVAVLPLLLYETGNLSLVAIPATLLTMPMVPLAMGLSALAGFAGMLIAPLEIGFLTWFAPALAVLFGLPAYLATEYLVFVARTSAALPLAAITLPPFPFWLVLVAYAALIFIAASKRFSTTPQLMFAKKASM